MSFVIVDPKKPIEELVAQGKAQYLHLVSLHVSLNLPAQILYSALDSINDIYGHFQTAQMGNNAEELLQDVSKLLNYKISDSVTQHVNERHAKALQVDNTHI